MGGSKFAIEITDVLDITGSGDEVEMDVYVHGIINPYTPATFLDQSYGGDVEDVVAHVMIFDQKVELSQEWVEAHNDVIVELAFEQMGER